MAFYAFGDNVEGVERTESWQKEGPLVGSQGASAMRAPKRRIGWSCADNSAAFDLLHRFWG